jgi:hypothetical protein
MIIDQHLDRKIGKILMEANKKERAEHKSSGKLSAFMLNWPLQHIMLKLKGIDPDPLEEYVIRKFKRGRDIEDWLVGHIDNVIERQKFVEYRNTIGYIDALVDSKGYEHECGIIPHEVKSVANAKFKRIESSGLIDTGHALQAAFYAVAGGYKWFAVDYVAADDLRILTMVDKTENYQFLIDARITEVEGQLTTGIVPVFEAREKWQADAKYNSYKGWLNLTQDEINSKLQTLQKAG